MIDTNLLLRDWLLSSSSITSLLGTNANGSIYCGDLPEKVDPSLGAVIQIQGVGGTPHTEVLPMADDRKQIRIWANVGQYKLARQIYGAVRDLIHGGQNVDFGADGHVIRCIEVTSGQDVTDPDTGWATVLAFYQLMAR
jgi:hypothetical protein